ncbi:putative quinol monooxygenase [Cryptosporangium sp. NPDC051539]|uniref:putative quinol monooxygenase n=1 Tax=Cryptosporangium sp. NPDC051539 TaxID=3363962 RepID=UPI0037956004
MGYVVSAIWTAADGNEKEVLAALTELAPLSRQEPGNRHYQAYQDPAEPLVFRLFEVYDDEAGYQAHVDSEHFRRLAFGTAIPLLENRERTFYRTIDV